MKTFIGITISRTAFSFNYFKFLPFNIDLAHRFVDSWRLPVHSTSVVNCRLGHYGHLIVPVRTETFKFRLKTL